MDDQNSKNSNLGDFVKKVVSTGIGAFFLTEEALKTAIQEKNLPLDIVQNLMQNMKGMKDEVFKQVKSELGGYLDKIDVSKEIGKILENYDLDVQAKIKFTKRKKE
jgi:hypothetical protein